MADTPFEKLTPGRRRTALSAAATATNGLDHLLEKDVWVVYTLRALMDTPYGEDLTLKGGTSLSKAYRAIRRFSEDLDVTYSILAIAPDLDLGPGMDPLPPNRSQERKWTKKIRRRLDEWVEASALPALQEAISGVDSSVVVRAEGDKLIVDYEPLFAYSDFVRPEVLVEFGARATGEPRERLSIGCDAAPHLEGAALPTARPYVMLAERTFWEKATSMHVFCRQRRKRGDRLSRHWHDLARLDEAGIGDRALTDRDLAVSVARHKAKFFREKDADGAWIDYEAAVSGDLQLVPEGSAYEALADDHRAMVRSGMLLDDEILFEDVIEGCLHIQSRANERIHSAMPRTVAPTPNT